MLSALRITYTVLALAVLAALLWGRDDPATNLFIGLASLTIIALTSLWFWLRDRQRHPS